MQEFNDFSGAELNVQNRRGLSYLFKRLKEALYFILILSKIVPESQSFMKNIFDDIQNNFEKLISTFEYEAD
jgi:hypothetical protein